MSVHVLERISRVTLLGVRFQDVATGSFVGDGLSVAVYPKGVPERRTPGTVNRSSVYVFNGLPGLRDSENGRGDAPYWAGEPPRFPFVLDVRDGAGRFQPFTVDVQLPVRGLLTFAIGSPLSSPLSPLSPLAQAAFTSASIPLFSTPSRAVPGLMGVLRAEIVDAVTGTPAAWALVEARGPGQRLAIGVADADGRVLVPLPYPKPIVTVGSPATPGIPLTSQSWTIDVAVRYRRRPVTPAAPDLADVLTQPPATAWRDVARTSPLAQAPLRFGRDLVLASAEPDGSLTPTLLIDPASSPP